MAEVDRLAALAEQRCVPLGPERAGAVRGSNGRPVTEAVTDRKLTTQAALTQEQALQTWATHSVREVRRQMIPSSTRPGRSPGWIGSYWSSDRPGPARPTRPPERSPC